MNANIVDLRIWSAAKRRYNDTPRSRIERWEELTPAQRQMFYQVEKARTRIIITNGEGPSS